MVTRVSARVIAAAAAAAVGTYLESWIVAEWFIVKSFFIHWYVADTEGKSWLLMTVTAAQ